MILYDTFSVSIPVDCSRKRKIRPASSVASERKRLCTPTSRSRSEASSSFDHSDGASTAEPCADNVLRSTRNENHLVNDKTKCTTRGRDEAKENLDPVKSKTLSRRLNNVNLMSEADMVIKSSYVYDENDDEIHTNSSDNSSALLNLINCSANVDNAVDGSVSSDCNQNLRSNLENVKQPNQTSSMEERNDGAKSFCKETTHNLDFNVINAYKSAEKVLHDDTVSTKENQHIDDNRIIIGDRTNDTARLWNNNKHLDSTNITRLKTQNQSAAQVSNTFNERSHKKNDAYNSKKFTRCRSLDGRFMKCSRSNCNGSFNNCSNNSFKISIDLNKIQNLIDAKPELFVNEKGNDEQHECTSHQANCTQRQITYNIEKNVNQRERESFKNSELQTSNDTSNVEQVSINRDTFSSMNTFASYQKPNITLNVSTNLSLINKMPKKFYIRNRQ